MKQLIFARSYLFIPAHKERFLAKIIDINSDIFIIDLEDAVPSNLKNSARHCFNEYYSTLAVELIKKKTYVRINPVKSNEHYYDLKSLQENNITNIVLPKIETSKDLDLLQSNYVEVGKIHEKLKVHCLIETAP